MALQRHICPMLAISSTALCFCLIQIKEASKSNSTQANQRYLILKNDTFMSKSLFTVASSLSSSKPCFYVYKNYLNVWISSYNNVKPFILNIGGSS